VQAADPGFGIGPTEMSLIILTPDALLGWLVGPLSGRLAPVLGYTVPYALGNILLTAWGPVIVMLTR
jgi:hypothetical protein